MEGVDWIIAGVGVAAIIATTLGVSFYEELAGETEITFGETEQALAQGSADVTTPKEFEWAARDNATVVSFDVTVTHNGQALNGGTVNYQVDVTLPDGSTHSESGSFQVAAGASTASGSITVEPPRFLAIPEDTNTTDVDGFDESFEWNTDYNVRVTVTPLADGAPVLGNPLGGYSYDATVSGTETYYQHVVVPSDVEIN